MSVFSGIGAQPGVAIAVAARLHVQYGVASFDPQRLRRIAAGLRAFGVESPEPEQVILVADTLPPGPVPTTQGLEIVGIAIGSDQPVSLLPNCPAVFGLGDDFWDSVEEDEIVIVDGSRGRIYVSPDAITVARYQSPQRSARRIFLDQNHLPARTATEGRLVAALALVVTQDDVATAMAAGADGVYLPPQNHWLGSREDLRTAAEQLSALESIHRQIGGLLLMIDMPPEDLALTALARGSVQGPVHWLLPNESVREDISERLGEIEALLDQDEIPYGTPDLDWAFTDVENSLLPEHLDGFAGVFLSEQALSAGMERLLPVASLAQRHHKPLTACLGRDWTDRLPPALSLGASRVIVPAEAVPEVKDAIRAW